MRHGSCIQSVPRKRMNASDSFQIHSSGCSRTLANSSPGIVDAAWQGQHLPFEDDRRSPPPAHARLRQILVEVGQHPEDVDAQADSLAEALDRLLGPLDLLPTA